MIDVKKLKEAIKAKEEVLRGVKADLRKPHTDQTFKLQMAQHLFRKEATALYTLRASLRGRGHCPTYTWKTADYSAIALLAERFRVEKPQKQKAVVNKASVA